MFLQSFNSSRPSSSQIIGKPSSRIQDIITSLSSQRQLSTISSADVLKIFRKHRADIVDKVSDPQRLAEKLCSKNLITSTVSRDILTTFGISDYRKACIIMNNVESSLSVGNVIVKFITLCEILMELFSNGCKEIVEEMKREIGVPD